MPEKKEEPFATLNTITIGTTRFHFIRVEGGIQRTGRTVAAQVNLSGVGGSYGSASERTYEVYALVSEGDQIVPLEVWEELKHRISEQTGISAQKIEIQPEGRNDLSYGTTTGSSGLPTEIP